MRPVILHYHLFKNAGTSIDANLKASFGDGWENYDHPQGHTISAEAIRDKFEQTPSLIALSSHDAAPPLPQGNFKLFPIVVLRHPIVRAHSAYAFECGKQLGLEQPEISFAEYVRERLNDLDGGVITNFQCCRLANQSPQGPDTGPAKPAPTTVQQAQAFIASLETFGLVEAFDTTIARLQRYLEPHFPGLEWRNQWQNATNHTPSPIPQRVSEIERELGSELFLRLCQRNQLDLDLYAFAAQRFYHTA
ncbi:sulfotransferase family 2 domain-containing protein [Gilvimarinus xylanilyticus]|uniref:Sulfotransferase family 2 domain-containing protein n=1 Tax=Gilvimarinus xylanilyticus TaxID=2944139 RepID=A0A9X2I2E8_9GAMM|nr:sulfotransferase family 2 domain-containing protein [Gilvimarinus xylanilyticus]MCP8898252.1 sulfotransferase family 2 domain-containing protein [Gilvimarinus xylanilyticus]